jgi:hypothetical protein
LLKDDLGVLSDFDAAFLEKTLDVTCRLHPDVVVLGRLSENVDHLWTREIYKLLDLLN